MTDRAKQALKGFAHGGVVIDDKDDGLLRAHWTPLSVGEAPSSLSGSVNRKMVRSEEHTSELQSLMRISYAVFCLKKKTNITKTKTRTNHNNKHTRYKPNR